MRDIDWWVGAAFVFSFTALCWSFSLSVYRDHHEFRCKAEGHAGAWVSPLFDAVCFDQVLLMPPAAPRLKSEGRAAT